MQYYVWKILGHFCCERVSIVSLDATENIRLLCSNTEFVYFFRLLCWDTETLKHWNTVGMLRIRNISPDVKQCLFLFPRIFAIIRIISYLYRYCTLESARVSICLSMLAWTRWGLNFVCVCRWWNEITRRTEIKKSLSFFKFMPATSAYIAFLDSHTRNSHQQFFLSLEATEFFRLSDIERQGNIACTSSSTLFLYSVCTCVDISLCRPL